LSSTVRFLEQATVSSFAGHNHDKRIRTQKVGDASRSGPLGDGFQLGSQCEAINLFCSIIVGSFYPAILHQSAVNNDIPSDMREDRFWKMQMP
jgi:hypothetical protein